MNIHNSWLEATCDCGATMFWSQGDPMDMTYFDAEAVRCWKCKKVHLLSDEEMPEDDEPYAEDTKSSIP